VQPDIVWEDKPANFSKIRALLRQTPPQPDSLVLLPEMFSTGFSMNLQVTQQHEPPEDERFLAALAKEYRCVVLGDLVSSGSAGMGQNQAVAFSPDGALLGRYTKIHPFSLGGEAERHEEGSEIVTFPWAGFTVAPLICYD